MGLVLWFLGRSVSAKVCIACFLLACINCEAFVFIVLLAMGSKQADALIHSKPPFTLICRLNLYDAKFLGSLSGVQFVQRQCLPMWRHADNSQ